jgi:hypothetical protein
VSKLLDPASLAGWIPLPALWMLSELASPEVIAALSRLSPSSFSHGGDHFSRYSYPSSGLVSGNVVGDNPEEWDEHFGIATRFRPKEV